MCQFRCAGRSTTLPPHMYALDWLYYILLLIFCVVGLFLNILGLPGLWLMVAAYGAYWWATARHDYVGIWSAVVIVDMRDEYRRRGEVMPVSELLAQELAACFARGDQALVLRNRRGWATALHCPACGERVECPSAECIPAHAPVHRSVRIAVGMLLMPGPGGGDDVAQLRILRLPVQILECLVRRCHQFGRITRARHRLPGSAPSVPRTPVA